jgi:hypothetical protein
MSPEEAKNSARYYTSWTDPSHQSPTIEDALESLKDARLAMWRNSHRLKLKLERAEKILLAVRREAEVMNEDLL